MHSWKSFKIKRHILNGRMQESFHIYIKVIMIINKRHIKMIQKDWFIYKDKHTYSNNIIKTKSMVLFIIFFLKNTFHIIFLKYINF